MIHTTQIGHQMELFLFASHFWYYVPNDSVITVLEVTFCTHTPPKPMNRF